MDDLVECAKTKVKEIETRKTICKKNLEIYRRLMQNDVANKEKMISKKLTQ